MSSYLCPCYKAEHKAYARCPVLGQLVEDPQAFVDFVTMHELFQQLRAAANQPEEPVTVTLGCRGRGYAVTKHQHIELTPGQVTQGVLLHELAHLCSPEGSYHDHRFCANYIKLVRHWLGALAAEELLRALREEGAFA